MGELGLIGINSRTNVKLHYADYKVFNIRFYDGILLVVTA